MFDQADGPVRDSGVKFGKYLTFRLSDEEYGLEIIKVREIIGLLTITKVPRTPDFVRGVMNLRGTVIPVINLRRKFCMDEILDTAETCVIVVEIRRKNEPIQVGILVDSVSEVLDIRSGDIEETPYFGAELDTTYILGMAKTKGSVRILLNIEKVLTEKEVIDIGKLKAGPEGLDITEN